MTVESHQLVSKLDAAGRQLHLSIDLFFADADPIGVHTIAGAAHGLLRDLFRRKHGRGIAPARKSIEVSTSRVVVERKIVEARNFFKHADRDPNHVLRFHPNWTDFLMFESIHLHMELAQTITRQHSIFLIWLSAKYPGVLLLDGCIGDTASLSKLRHVFSSLGSPSAQKRTFRAAMG